MGAVLGVDTSCYTTSCALADESGLLGQQRRLLSVALGGRGLMQSEGVFQHVGRLPGLMERLLDEANHPAISAVCAPEIFSSSSAISFCRRSRSSLFS